MSKIKTTFFTIFLSFILTACGSGSSADLEYVALGASDAFGIGATPITNGYVYLIEEGIEANGRETELENLGIPGAEIDNIKNLEFPFLDRDEPNLVTLSTGVNDIIDGDDPVAFFEEDLKELLEKIRDNTKDNAIIAISNIPNLLQVPRFIEEPDGDVTAARIIAFNQAFARQAAAAGALLVDLNSLPINESLNRDEDGFHPNDAGHRAIADAFLNVIVPQLGSISGQ